MKQRRDIKKVSASSLSRRSKCTRWGVMHLQTDPIISLFNNRSSRRTARNNPHRSSEQVASTGTEEMGGRSAILGMEGLAGHTSLCMQVLWYLMTASLPHSGDTVHPALSLVQGETASHRSLEKVVREGLGSAQSHKTAQTVDAQLYVASLWLRSPVSLSYPWDEGWWLSRPERFDFIQERLRLRFVGACAAANFHTGRLRLSAARQKRTQPAAAVVVESRHHILMLKKTS